MAIGARHLSLVVPGLLGPVDLMDRGQLPVAPALSLLLRRAHRSAAPYPDYESLLFGLFGLQGEELPVAPLSYRYDAGLDCEAWCMRADPVFMLPGQSSLMVMASGESLQLTADEAASMEGDLNAHFAPQGLRFHAPHPHRWYCFSERQQLHTTSLRQVQGRPVQGHLPRGEDGVYWNGILAEVQMLLHQHPVNLQRQATGLPQVNSLWFWGQGSVPALAASPWSQCWGSEALLAGLATATGCVHEAAPPSAAQWLQQAGAGEHLMVLPQLLSALPDLPQAEWGRYLESLQQHWIAPLLQALRQGRLQRLTLYPLNGYAYTLSRARLWRWWRRPRGLDKELLISDYA